MQRAAVLTRSPDAISCELESGAAILDSRSNVYFSLNTTGTLVWNMLPASVEEIIKALVNDFGVERSRVAADVEALIGQLESNKLISVTEGASTDASRPA